MLFSFSEAQFCFRGSTGYAFPILGSTALLLLYLGMCFLIFGKQKLRFSWKHGLCFFFKCASILPENGSTGCAFLSFFEDRSLDMERQHAGANFICGSGGGSQVPETPSVPTAGVSASSASMGGTAAFLAASPLPWPDLLAGRGRLRHVKHRGGQSTAY